MNAYMRVGLLTAVALAAVFGMTSTALADFLPHGTYTLGSHPSTTDNPPPLGLRLDRLFGTPGKFAFDFDNPLSNMVMDFDGSSIRIHGNAFGGHDGGMDFANDGYQGVYAVDFTYQANIVEFANGDVALQVSPSALNNGTITSPGSIPGGEQTVTLTERADMDGNSFYLAFNHRGFAGLSGFGWLDFPGRPDHALADWLFTAEFQGGNGGNPPVIPAPGAVVLAAIGLGTLGCVRRRRSQG
jgi:hypothetical protein